MKGCNLLLQEHAGLQGRGDSGLVRSHVCTMLQCVAMRLSQTDSGLFWYFVCIQFVLLLATQGIMHVLCKVMCAYLELT